MNDRNERLAGVPLLELSTMPPALVQRLQPRVERLGYLGGFFRIAAHQPEALAAFVDFTEACRTALPDVDAELVALTVATSMGNDYERVQHEQLAVRSGLAVPWIRAVERLSPHRQALLSDDHQVIQSWILAALHDRGHDSGVALEEMVTRVGVDRAVGVVLLCARYVAHALVVNSFGIEPPVESVFGSSSVLQMDNL